MQFPLPVLVLPKHDVLSLIQNLVAFAPERVTPYLLGVVTVTIGFHGFQKNFFHAHIHCALPKGLNRGLAGDEVAAGG